MNQLLLKAKRCALIEDTLLAIDITIFASPITRPESGVCEPSGATLLGSSDKNGAILPELDGSSAHLWKT